MNNPVRVSRRILDEIQHRINKHHELYPRLAINSQQWENVLYDSLLMDYDNVEWDPGSHKAGTDIVCEGINISCKGGSILGKQVPQLKISSYRTTRYKTLDEKLSYLRLRHEDVIFSLARYNGGYRFTIFEPPNVDLFEWATSDGGWQGKDEKGNILSIVKRMSDQYWIHLIYDKLDKEVHDFTISQ